MKNGWHPTYVAVSAVTAAVAFAMPIAAPAKAQTPEAQRLYGAPTMVVAQQLGRQGFQMLRSFSSRGTVRTYFLHPNTGRCLLQTAMNGRTTGIDERPSQECGEGGSAAPGYAPPAYAQPGGPQGNGDFYRDFLGMSERDSRNELQRRGYRRVQGGPAQYWWHDERQLCALVVVSGGRVSQMEQVYPGNCWQRGPRRR